MITTPGVYDLDEAAYHVDPCEPASLSSSGARMLLDACPARYWHERAHPAPPSEAFDVGHVMHALVLGRGMKYGVVEAADWRTKAAKLARDVIRSHGRIPILGAQRDAAYEMLEAFEAHPFAAAAFKRGKAEQTLIWRDEEFGIWKRARLDWLPDSGPFVADYKTCASAHPDDLRKALFNFGYYQQAAWYLDGLHALELVENASFIFIFQEKTPPYEVVAVQPDAAAIEWGRLRNRRASEIFARSLEADRWAGYADDVLTLGLPYWAERQLEHEHEMGAYA